MRWKIRYFNSEHPKTLDKVFGPERMNFSVTICSSLFTIEGIISLCINKLFKDSLLYTNMRLYCELHHIITIECSNMYNLLLYLLLYLVHKILATSFPKHHNQSLRRLLHIHTVIAATHRRVRVSMCGCVRFPFHPEGRWQEFLIHQDTSWPRHWHCQRYVTFMCIYTESSERCALQLYMHLQQL